MSDSDSESQNNDYEGYEEHKQKAEMLWWNQKYEEANQEFKALFPLLSAGQSEEKQFISQFAMEMNEQQVEMAEEEEDNEKLVAHLIWAGYWKNTHLVVQVAEDEDIE